MLSEALRLIRVFHDMKQNELASRLGVSTSYLSEIEKGKKTPSVDIIQKYASEFQIPPSSILFFSEELQSNSENDEQSNRVKGRISEKIIQFLRVIEARTVSGAEEVS